MEAVQSFDNTGAQRALHYTVSALPQPFPELSLGHWILLQPQPLRIGDFCSYLVIGMHKPKSFQFGCRTFMSSFQPLGSYPADNSFGVGSSPALGRDWGVSISARLWTIAWLWCTAHIISVYFPELHFSVPTFLLSVVKRWKMPAKLAV